MHRLACLLSLFAIACGPALAEDQALEAAGRAGASPGLLAALHADTLHAGLQLRAEPVVLPDAEPGSIETRLRWWLRKGPGDLGIGLRSDHGFDTQRLQPVSWRPTVSVGWQSRSGHATLYADAAALSSQGQVGVEWTPARRLPMGLRDGLLGVRLDSGYRVSLKPRKGGLALYMRGQF